MEDYTSDCANLLVAMLKELNIDISSGKASNAITNTSVAIDNLYNGYDSSGDKVS